MKSIEIHPAITIVDEAGAPVIKDGAPASVSFAEFVRFRTRDPRFGTDGVMGLDDLEAALNVRRRIDEAVNSGASVVVLDNDHHARLLRATQRPTGGYIPGAEQLLPFMRAVRDAKDA